MAPTDQLLSKTEGHLSTTSSVKRSIRSSTATGERGETRDEPEEGVVRPVGHPVLGDRLVSTTGDEGEEAPGGGGAPRDLSTTREKPSSSLAARNAAEVPKG